MSRRKFLITRAGFFSWLLVFSLAGSGCSVNISQTPQAAPSLLTAIVPPISTSDINPTQPTIPSISTPDINPTQLDVTPTNSLPTTKIAVTWGNLNLTGKLVYTTGDIQVDTITVDIQSLDLATGVITTIFKAPKYSWIYYVAVSPDRKQLLMSYVAPPTNNAPARPALYLLPLDGSQPPQLLFIPPTADDNYLQVEWSPDGKYIYFTQFNPRLPSQPGQINPVLNIFRMRYPDGQPEMIIEKAYWPRLSSDSSHLVYVYVDPFSFKNKLYVADSDGGNAHPIAVSGSWNPDVKDAPIFSPDAQSIILSAVVPLPSYQPNWVEKLMGIRPAKADGSIPSDWWSVPIAGGALTRLTHIQSLGLFASLSPDDQHLASFSSDGIFVMNPDGSELTSIFRNLGGISGTVSWIP
jgi:Tol biopolymer transport system component